MVPTGCQLTIPWGLFGTPWKVLETFSNQLGRKFIWDKAQVIREGCGAVILRAAYWAGGQAFPKKEKKARGKVK